MRVGLIGAGNTARAVARGLTDPALVSKVSGGGALASGHEAWSAR